MGEFLVSLATQKARVCAGCSEATTSSPDTVNFAFPVSDGTCTGCSGYNSGLTILCSEESECVWGECFVTYCGGKTVELFFHYDSVEGRWEMYGVDTTDPMTIILRYNGPATWDGVSPIVLTQDVVPADCVGWPPSTTLSLVPVVDIPEEAVEEV